MHCHFPTPEKAAELIAQESRPRNPGGRKLKLSAEQQAELRAWWLRRRALGSNKTKAAELGISTAAITAYLGRFQKAEQAHERAR